MSKTVTPAATKIIGTTPKGATITLIYIDEVEEYISDGTYHDFIRVTVCNHQEQARDSFLFDTENDYKLAHSYIQTSEKTMELLTLYMMNIQNKEDLNSFVVETAKKLQADFGYIGVQMIDNSINKGVYVEN